jgi:hypothetical protein
VSLVAFLIWLVIAALLAVVPAWASFVYLEDLGRLAPSLGYNATNLQNGLVITTVGLAALLLARALWARLSPINVMLRLGFVVVLFAATAIALLNGPLFLRPVLPIPPDVSNTLLVGSLIATAAGIALAIVRPEHRR